jgi:type II secretory pathway component PulJ
MLRWSEQFISIVSGFGARASCSSQVWYISRNALASGSYVLLLEPWASAHRLIHPYGARKHPRQAPGATRWSKQLIISTMSGFGASHRCVCPNGPRIYRRQAPCRSQIPPGFSLLELLLALSLTVVVLGLVNMAVQLHLRSLNDRRMQLEESQLARSVLKMIADDLRGAVQHYEQDMSAIETLLQQSAATAAGSLGASAQQALDGASGGASAGQPDGQPAEDGASTSDLQSQVQAAGQQFSSSGRSTTSSSASSGGQSSTSSSGSSSSSTDPDSAGQNTEDLSTATIPPVPGLFGNQYQLQVDVSRLPRIEEYQRYLTADMATSVVDIPSDVKTVTYFVQSLPPSGTTAPSEALEDLSDPNAGAGLVRRVLDRSVTLWAMNNGNYSGLQNSGEVIAPEVAAIEFQYFNGTEWVLEWDTEVEKQLPIAVLVVLAIRPPGSVPAADVPVGPLTPETAGDLHLYRMLINLPAGGQTSASEAATESGSSDSSSTATGSDTSGGSL